MTNIIAEAASKAVKPVVKSPAVRMQEIVNHPATMKILETSLKENAGSFSASIIDLYNSDKTLQQCDPGKVFAECLKAVSLKLPINKQLGFAYIIPYRDGKTGEQIPTFIVGYKGLLQLCMRTGAYKYINAGPVYDGEVKIVDKLTGCVDLNGERVSDKIVGYFAYIETVNGFSKAMYWDNAKLTAHIKKYSKAYNAGTSIWRDNFDEMATKTILRNLLSHWGVMSVEMATAVTVDDNADAADNAIVADMETGEIIQEPQNIGDGTVK